jgi:hypothetical protein
MAFPAFLSALFNERIEINTLLGKILIIHPFSKMAAEAFGLAASALAVVQLSAKIVKICAQHTKDVANARQDIQRLQREVGILGLVADSVRELTDDTSQHKLTTIEKVQSFLDEARTRLSELHTKLDPGQRKEDMWRVGLRAIKWPFSSKDAEKALADLARLTQAISLAISVDQT